MQALTPQDVQRALDTFDFDINIQKYDTSTATSELAAAAIGCEVGQIAKSICFMINKTQPLLVIASGDQNVDDRKLATLLGVGRKKVRMAKPNQCVEIFGYAPGGVPPIAHRTPNIPIYLDDMLKRYQRVYAAAGSSSINFGMTIEQLTIMTNGTWADLTKAT